MRARIRRRQRVRRLTILVTFVVIAVSLVFGFYVALSGGSSPIDRYIGQPVSSADMASLYQLSHAAYGPSGSSLLVTSGQGQNLRDATGQPFVSGGRPVVVYIGGDFCPYCAVERWSLILSLSRFGNFSDLHYMTSAPTEGDYATFTFTGSSYSSKYVVFQPFEQEDRNQHIQLTVPSNYTASFTNSYPFVNFGNKYLLQTLIPDTSILAGKNWTQIMSSIATGDLTGVLLKQGANAVTGIICKLTGSVPSSVCSQSAVASTAAGLGSPTGSSEGTLAMASLTPRVFPTGRLR